MAKKAKFSKSCRGVGGGPNLVVRAVDRSSKIVVARLPLKDDDVSQPTRSQMGGRQSVIYLGWRRLEGRVILFVTKLLQAKVPKIHSCNSWLLLSCRSNRHYFPNRLCVAQECVKPRC